MGRAGAGLPPQRTDPKQGTLTEPSASRVTPRKQTSANPASQPQASHHEESPKLHIFSSAALGSASSTWFKTSSQLPTGRPLEHRHKHRHQNKNGRSTVRRKEDQLTADRETVMSAGRCVVCRCHSHRQAASERLVFTARRLRRWLPEIVQHWNTRLDRSIRTDEHAGRRCFLRSPGAGARAEACSWARGPGDPEPLQRARAV